MKNTKDSREQGDQIGDCLLWAVFQKLQKYLEPFFGYFLKLKSNIKCGENGLGYILGDSFKNSSGHPGRESAPWSAPIVNVTDICSHCQVRNSTLLSGDGQYIRAFVHYYVNRTIENLRYMIK
jgi:hypothetical protein